MCLTFSSQFLLLKKEEKIHRYHFQVKNYVVNNFKMLYLYLAYTFAMQTKLVPWAVIIAISNQIENYFFLKLRKRRKIVQEKKCDIISL